MSQGEAFVNVNELTPQFGGGSRDSSAAGSLPATEQETVLCATPELDASQYGEQDFLCKICRGEVKISQVVWVPTPMCAQD
jgi:hypothetical protein